MLLCLCANHCANLIYFYGGMAAHECESAVATWKYMSDHGSRIVLKREFVSYRARRCADQFSVPADIVPSPC